MHEIMVKKNLSYMFNMKNIKDYCCKNKQKIKIYL